MTDFLYMTVSASILITVIVIIRALFLHKLPKRVFNLLWTVAVLRLLIPFSFAVDMPVYGFTGPGEQYTVTADYPSDGISAVSRGTADIQNIILFVWVCGVIVCGAAVTVSHLRFKKRYSTAVLFDDPYIGSCISWAGLKRRVTVKLCSNIDSPMTTGILEPVIYLPKSLCCENNKREIDFIIAHELVHIRRFDVLYKIALTAAVCLHWFNGFVWAMYVLANRDIELSCDEEVLQQMNCERADYALALIGLEEKRSILPGASAFGGNSVAERIEAIMKTGKPNTLGIIVSVCLTVFSTAVFAMPANNTESMIAVEGAAVPMTEISDAEVTDAFYSDDNALQAVEYPTTAGESSYIEIEDTAVSVEDVSDTEITEVFYVDNDAFQVSEYPIYVMVSSVSYDVIEDVYEYSSVPLDKSYCIVENEAAAVCTESDEVDLSYLFDYIYYILSFNDDYMISVCEKGAVIGSAETFESESEYK